MQRRTEAPSVAAVVEGEEAVEEGAEAMPKTGKQQH